MSETRYDSSRWTGDLTPIPVDPQDVRRRIRFGLPLLVVILVFPIYQVAWHEVWKTVGSPPVISNPNILAFAVPLASAFVGYFLGREWQKWPLMCAAVSGCVASTVYVTGSFLIDRSSPMALGEFRAFVETARPPRYPLRRHARLQHELRLSTGHGREVTALVPEPIYRQVIGGDTCLQIQWAGGRGFLFIRSIQRVPTGDGNGSWLNAEKDRRACFSYRIER